MGESWKLSKLVSARKGGTMAECRAEEEVAALNYSQGKGDGRRGKHSALGKKSTSP